LHGELDRGQAPGSLLGLRLPRPGEKVRAEESIIVAAVEEGCSPELGLPPLFVASLPVAE